MIVLCSMTGCKHNSACCFITKQETYCTLDKIRLTVNDETGEMDCENFKCDYTKPLDCECCIEKAKQIKN